MPTDEDDKPLPLADWGSVEGELRQPEQVPQITTAQQELESWRPTFATISDLPLEQLMSQHFACQSAHNAEAMLTFEDVYRHLKAMLDIKPAEEVVKKKRGPKPRSSTVEGVIEWQAQVHQANEAWRISIRQRNEAVIQWNAYVEKMRLEYQRLKMCKP